MAKEKKNQKKLNDFDNIDFISLEKEAEKGDIDAQHRVVDCYSKGYGTAINFNKAFEWLEKIVQPNDNVRPLNSDKNSYLPPNNKRDRLALYKFANCYFNGHGVEQNYSEAVKWFKESGQPDLRRYFREEGFSQAQIALGICYFNGYGVEKNNDKAIEWFTKAQNQKDAMGYVWLAYLGSIKNKQIDEELAQHYSHLIFCGKIIGDNEFLISPPKFKNKQDEEDYETRKDKYVKAKKLNEQKINISNLLQQAVVFFFPQEEVYDDNKYECLSDIFLGEIYSFLKSMENNFAKVILAYYERYKSNVNNALNYLEEANKQGDIIACRELGKYYKEQKKFDKALTYFKKIRDFKILPYASRGYRTKESTFANHTIELIEYKERLEQQNQKLKLEIEQKEIAQKEAHNKEKEMLSFFTHTMRNALATAPESLRQAIRLLGSEDYEKNQKHYEAINEITGLFSTLSLTDCLIDTFKQSIYDTEEFQRNWQQDNSGEATPEWFIAIALRQSLNRIIFMSTPRELKKLLGNDKSLIKPTRKAFIEQVLPLDSNQQDVELFFQWLTSLSAIEVNIAPTSLHFGANQIKFSLLFAISSELTLNALKYWSGEGYIQIDWQQESDYYVFRVKNSCKANANSQLAGTHKGLAFIQRLVDLLDEQGEHAQLNYFADNEVFTAELKLHQCLLEGSL